MKNSLSVQILVVAFIVGAAGEIFGLQSRTGLEQSVPKFESLQYDEYQSWIRKNYKSASLEDQEDRDLLKNWLENAPRTSQEIESTLASNNTSLAVAAAWRAIRMRASDLDSLMEFDYLDCKSFPSFVLGRVGVCPPKFWSSAMSDTAFDSKTGKFRPEPTTDSLSQFVDWVPEYNCWVQKGVSIRVKDKVIFVAVGNKQIAAEFSSNKTAVEYLERNVVVCEFEGTYAFLVVHSKDHAIGTTLSSWSLSDGESNFEWEQPIVSSGLNYSGAIELEPTASIRSLIDIIVTDDKVLVFGINTRSLYFEGFRKEDGLRTMSFSTKQDRFWSGK